MDGHPISRSEARARAKYLTRVARPLGIDFPGWAAASVIPFLPSKPDALHAWNLEEGGGQMVVLVGSSLVFATWNDGRRPNGEDGQVSVEVRPLTEIQSIRVDPNPHFYVYYAGTSSPVHSEAQGSASVVLRNEVEGFGDQVALTPAEPLDYRDDQSFAQILISLIAERVLDFEWASGGDE